MPDALIQSLLEALHHSPDNTPLRLQIIELLLKAKDSQRALDLAQAGLSMQPASATLKLALAKCFLRQAKPSAAIVLLEETLKHPSTPTSSRILLAQALLAEGQTQRAQAVYETAIDLDPSLANPKLAAALGLDDHGPASPTQPRPHRPGSQNPGPPTPPSDFSEHLHHADEDDDNEPKWTMSGGTHRPFDAGNDPGYDTSGDADDFFDTSEVDPAGRVRHTHATDGFEGLQMEKPDTDFNDVGGMDAVKKSIEIKIIAPLKHPDLYKAYGKKTGGGILMYGPPGCGKTHLARATAGQVNAAFLSVSIHDVMDMWMGNSEKRLHGIFEQARRNQPCVLFFDEVDALAANRSQMHGNSGRSMINQFLDELDGLKSNNDGLLILAATNAPWHLDPAFRRPGRFDRVLFVPPPDVAGRASILDLHLRDKPQQKLDTQKVAVKTHNFSGADLKALVDQTVEEKLEQAMQTGVPTPITTKDLLKATKAVKPSTQAWFATAKNHALYANDGGLYDDVLDHMNLR